MTEEKQIISVTMVGGYDVLGILENQTFDEDGTLVSIEVRDPQIYNLLGNQFLPFGATAMIPERVFTFKPNHFIMACEAIPMFREAYRQTFPHHFPEDKTEMEKDQEARIQMLESASPVHGNVKSEGGIILKA